MVAVPGGAGERILIVEDDESYRSYLELRLSRDGYVPTSFARGGDALAALDEVAPSVVITDLLMPAMSGIDFCRAIRSSPGHEHLPIMLLSGASDSAAIGEVVGLGLIWYLSKSASWDHFRKTMQNLIARSEAVPNGA